MKHIESESQYKEIMARIEELLPLITEDTPEDDVNSMELVRLSILVEDYEKEYYPIEETNRNTWRKEKHKRAVLTPKLLKVIEKSRRQIANGKCITCNTKEELNAFIDSLGEK